MSTLLALVTGIHHLVHSLCASCSDNGNAVVSTGTGVAAGAAGLAGAAASYSPDAPPGPSSSQDPGMSPEPPERNPFPDSDPAHQDFPATTVPLTVALDLLAGPVVHGVAHGLHLAGGTARAVEVGLMGATTSVDVAETVEHSMEGGGGGEGGGAHGAAGHPASGAPHVGGEPGHWVPEAPPGQSGADPAGPSLDGGYSSEPPPMSSAAGDVAGSD